MKVSEAMTRNVRIINPEQPILDAAVIMSEIDAGVVPVGEDDRLVGMITDRDIAVRAIAQGRGPDAKVRDVMTRDVKYCFDDEETEHVAGNMGDQQIRRIPVVDREKKLVGILSLGDLARQEETARAGEALEGIARPGGNHS